MKIRIFLVAVFCSLLVWQLKTGMSYSKTVYTHPTLPGGTYLASCNNVKMVTQTRNGSNVVRIITADCLDVNGNPQKTSITLPVMTNEYLDFTLENVNGTLKSFQPQLQ